MYLSRLLLNPRHRAVWRELADCQAMHRRVMSAFPDVTNTTQAREQYCVLYRVEHRVQRREVALLVQATIAPDWSRLPARYLSEASTDGSLSCKQVGTVFEALQQYPMLRFRLRANPTRKIETKSGADGARRNGKRVEIRDEDGQLAWLARKGEQHGFRLRTVRAFPDVPNVRAVYEDKTVGRRQQTSSGAKTAPPARLTFGSVLFDGELAIADVDLFRQALMRGVGTGKAYGFGLLSIAPVAR